MCVICAGSQSIRREHHVSPVRDASISKQDVKHFSADLVLVIAPHSWVVNALKIVCLYLSKLISAYCPKQHKNTPPL